jgi:hypothetical protein
VTILKLYYDGWLALPPAALQQLGVDTGGVLEAELVDDGTILLRPTAKGMSKGQQQVLSDDVAAHEAETIPGVPEQILPPVTRRPGRPRKAVMAATPQPASATNGSHGTLSEPAPHLEQEPTPVVESRAQSELRRKVALPVSFLDDIPARGRRAERLSASTGYEREERRPFPHVEVRKLGPGRGHNKARRLAS